MHFSEIGTNTGVEKIKSHVLVTLSCVEVFLPLDSNISFC